LQGSNKIRGDIKRPHTPWQDHLHWEASIQTYHCLTTHTVDYRYHPYYKILHFHRHPVQPTAMKRGCPGCSSGQPWPKRHRTARIKSEPRRMLKGEHDTPNFTIRLLHQSQMRRWQMNQSTLKHHPHTQSRQALFCFCFLFCGAGDLS
jgi:hypothetical protein